MKASLILLRKKYSRVIECFAEKMGISLNTEYQKKTVNKSRDDA